MAVRHAARLHACVLCVTPLNYAESPLYTSNASWRLRCAMEGIGMENGPGKNDNDHI